MTLPARTRLRPHAPLASRVRVALALALLASVGSLFGPAAALADASTAARLSAVVARILSYDRSLPQRAGTTVDIVVVYAPGNAASQGEARAFERGFAAMSGSTIQGLPLAATVRPYSASAIESGTDVVIVCEGLEGSIDAIAAVTRRRHLLTVGVARAYASRATALAVVFEDGRPKIIANLAHARAEGVELSSQLLRLAEVL